MCIRDRLIRVHSENDSRMYFLIVLTTDYCWRSWTSCIAAPYKSRVDWLIDWLIIGSICSQWNSFTSLQAGRENSNSSSSSSSSSITTTTIVGAATTTINFVLGKHKPVFVEDRPDIPAKVATLERNRRFSIYFRSLAPQPYDLAKEVQLTLIGSPLRAFQ